MNQCRTCEEAITNPVCPECLERQIQDWLLRRSPENVEVLNDMTDKHVYVKSGSTKCIFCAKQMDICTYCFTEDVFNWLKTTDQTLLKEFMTYFNFDGKGLGYAKEALALKVL